MLEGLLPSPSLTGGPTVTPSSASSGGSNTASLPINLGWGSGAGTRGFVNNVNMGGKQVNDQPVSGGGSAGLLGSVPGYAWAIVGVALALLILRKK